MGMGTSILQPQELVSFKRLSSNVPLDSIIIPEKTENRRPTNLKWLIAMGVCTLILMPFMIYVLVNSDIKRLIYGYDQCGNVCGYQNSKLDDIPCSGKDMTTLPYLLFNSRDTSSLLSSRECVANCPPSHELVGKICIPKTSDNNYDDNTFDSNYDTEVTTTKLGDSVAVFFDSVKWQLIICCLLSILVSMGTVYLFRYVTGCLIWSLLIGSFAAFAILTIFVWVAYAMTDEENTKQVYLGPCVGLTVFIICYGAIFLFLRKKISLVILLIREAVKAVFDMPQLIIVPVVAFFATFILTLIYLSVTLAMLSSGRLVEILDGFYEYQTDNLIHFTLIFNSVIFLWLNMFFSGVQYMVVSGAISQWYFTRDKSYLNKPIATSLTNTFRFHLGSVALGSWIITLVGILRALILSLINNEKLRILVDCILKPIENLIRFLSKNAYIMTGIHGEAFLKSGKRAAKILVDNLGDVVAINYIGDFIIGTIQLLVVIVTLLLSAAVFAIAPSANPSFNILIYVLVGFVALISAVITFNVFNTAIDTLFICYCEDKLLNDGMSKPFYMSRNLMEFIEDSKKVFKKLQK